ncbi:YbgA family protein [Bermanella sp. R86510]|uniref:YbgA family protein n=1 Tax=unclassified Bermanella TaxID=2627862 RepID=UPI0037CA78CF
MTIHVAISSCLLGEKVRYNGGHKRSHYIDNVLSNYFNFVPICPEVGIGMGTPRKAIRLITTSSNNQEGIEAVETGDNSVRYTQQLTDYARAQAQQIKDVSGYIFMQKSPSCGYTRVKLYHENGNPLEVTQGIYAAEIERLLPLIPKEEAGRLTDPMLRENFITRVMAYHDWQENVAADLNKKSLMDFHTRHKYLLMAHHIPSYQSLGRLMSDLKGRSLEEIAQDYIEGFMAALKHIANRKKNSNVMQHLQGYVKKHLTSEERQEMRNVIDQYRTGIVPLVAPLTLLNHHINKHTQDDGYLLKQSYLNPHPFELGLRNAV